MKIGIVGYSGKSFPIFKASNLIKQSISLIVKKANLISTKAEIEIVSGGTDYGIPALTYSIFKNKVSLVAIVPKIALTMNFCEVDKTIVIGENFGDESDHFLKYIDSLIRIGGGEQSLKEAELFKKLKPKGILIEHELEFYK